MLTIATYAKFYGQHCISNAMQTYMLDYICPLTLMANREYLGVIWALCIYSFPEGTS